MRTRVNVAVQLKYDSIREESNTTNQKFLDSIDEGMKKVIKEQVKKEDSKITPKIEKLVIDQLESEVLMEANNSINRSDDQEPSTLEQNSGSSKEECPEENASTSDPSETKTTTAGKDFGKGVHDDKQNEEVTNIFTELFSTTYPRLPSPDQAWENKEAQPHNANTYSPIEKTRRYTHTPIQEDYIYENTRQKNCLMRIDELHKFSDGTLDDVRTALNDRLKGIRMEYLPQTFWSQRDKANARAMIQAIDKRLKTRRIMKSLERFIVEDPYGAGNPVKKILLKLNLSDHRSILTDLKSSLATDTTHLSRSVNVLKLKNFKKDATLKLYKSSNQEWYEHVGPEVASPQDDKVPRWRRDCAWLMISICSRSQCQIQVQGTSSIQKTDNGTEFVNQTLREYYKKVCISHETYIDRSLQQNGVVERRNHTLIEVAHTMLIYAKAPLILWAEVVATACYTQNRSIIRLCHGKTPYELLHDKLLDLSFFYVFGALCYPTNDSENLGKLQPKDDIGIFIGYAPTKKAFRIYNRHTRRVIKTIHVDFHELTAMASEHSSSGLTLHEMTPTTISLGLVPNPPPSTPFVPPSRTN
ncbi:retrovirus-related pol polyprotein from transposon TNT 1-94 [Tanacetum coccineum]|uniref:Retrovirus-related pol polyprotein from transposon TNT 1-94 n=1 Tax=Tanacetum coccineum TaxID=301880 RepID=A0ABQ5CR57_9ASTR